MFLLFINGCHYSNGNDEYINPDLDVTYYRLYSGSTPSILLFGDSRFNMYDWTFFGNYIFDYSRSGSGITGVENRLDYISLITNENFDIIISEVGINDCNITGIELFIERYKTVINKYKKLSNRIIIMGIVPTTSYYENPINNNVTSFVNSSIKSMCQEVGVEYMDVSFMIDYNGWLINEYSLPDGIHYNNYGYSVFIDKIQSHINK